MATYLQNILPVKHLTYNTPLHILYNQVPSYAHLRVFGCLCYPLRPSPTIHKLQPRSSPCVFLGYPKNHRGYICFELDSKKITISRHIIFDELRFPFSSLCNPTPSSYDFLQSGFSPTVMHQLVNQNNGPPVPLSQDHSGTQPTDSLTSPVSSPPDLSQPMLSGPSSTPLAGPPAVPAPRAAQSISGRRPNTRSQSGIVKPNPKYCFHSSMSKSPIPSNPISALRDPNWKLAMDDEFNALINNETWVLVPRPLNVNIIRSMWLFSHKS